MSVINCPEPSTPEHSGKLETGNIGPDICRGCCLASWFVLVGAGPVVETRSCRRQATAAAWAPHVSSLQKCTSSRNCLGWAEVIPRPRGGSFPGNQKPARTDQKWSDRHLCVRPQTEKFLMSRFGHVFRSYSLEAGNGGRDELEQRMPSNHGPSGSLFPLERGARGQPRQPEILLGERHRPGCVSAGHWPTKAWPCAGTCFRRRSAAARRVPSSPPASRAGRNRRRFNSTPLQG